jgi:predicted Zn-dependent protease
VRASHVSVAASLNTVYTKRIVANSDDFRCADVLNRKAAYKGIKVVEQQVPF